MQHDHDFPRSRPSIKSPFMNLNLTARLISLISRLDQRVSKIDRQAEWQNFMKRLDLNRPANFLERWIFNIFEFAFVIPVLGLSFLLNDKFRERVYYLYEHPDHDDSLCLYPYLTRRHPYTTRWIVYLFPKVKHVWQKCLRFSQALKALVPTYNASPPMFGFSPKLASVIHGVSEWAEGSKVRNGFIRIHYAPSFEDGRYQAGFDFEPMLSIDLPVTRAGIDLHPLYSKWGLESVAFIVDNKFRPIFKPADSHVLSPAAAYDLSKDFTRPVRVFEPEVSKYTINKRRLHYPLFIVVFFFISLLGLACGEPTDRIYMCNLYGHRYADIYECLSRWSSGPRSATKIIFHWAALSLGSIFYFTFLFVQVVVGAIRWTLMSAAAAPGWWAASIVATVHWTLRKCVAVLESVAVQMLDAVSLAFSLQWKTWAVAIPACWMLYVELRHMVIG